MVSSASQGTAPVSDAIVTALAKLVDDAQGESRRDPSHSDLEFLISRAGLRAGDPAAQGMTVGKAKRVRAVLSWGIESDYHAAERLVFALVAQVRGCGGFRIGSPNFVGGEQIRNLVEAFEVEGYALSATGELAPFVLDNLEGPQLSAALRAYIRRAKRGVVDAALVTGTAKDLLEAIAAHILVERYGDYRGQSDFPTLLGQAYAALGLPTPVDAPKPNEGPQSRLARALFEGACAVNNLRNRQGTGHGRPWLPTVTDAEARTAVELMGVIGEFLLTTHEAAP